MEVKAVIPAFPDHPAPKALVCREQEEGRFVPVGQTPAALSPMCPSSPVGIGQEELEELRFPLSELLMHPFSKLRPHIKAPDNKDFWIIDEEAAEVVRLIFRLFLDGKNRNQIAVYLTQEQIPTPTFYMKDRGRGTCKNKTLNEDNRYKWNKATLTHILTRQEYCGDVVNFKTTKHFRDKRNHYVDRSQWHITENVHEPIIDRTDFENVQRILENAPVKRPNGDGEIHPLSGLLFCKDCGAKMHIRIDYRNGGKRHVAYCSEYHKGKAKNPKCSSPHIMDADLLMQTVADVLKKIAEYSISNRAEFEALVKKSLAMQQTDKTKKQQKRIPQITTRLEQIDKVLNKLYEDNALGTIPQDRYEQMSQKYSEEYYSLKAELEQLREQLSAFENAGGRAQKFVKLIDRYADFTDLTPTIRTHNTNLKRRLAAYAEQYPDECCKTDTDPETGCMEFDIAKGRFSFRLTAPYSEERREAARRYAKENNAADRLK